jgi:hypothetical protein
MPAPPWHFFQAFSNVGLHSSFIKFNWVICTRPQPIPLDSHDDRRPEGRPAFNKRSPCRHRSSATKPINDRPAAIEISNQASGTRRSACLPYPLEFYPDMTTAYRAFAPENWLRAHHCPAAARIDKWPKWGQQRAYAVGGAYGCSAPRTVLRRATTGRPGSTLSDR